MPARFNGAQTAALAVLFAALATLLCAPLAAEEPRVLSITGEGVITRVPDAATIRLGVVTEAETAQDALGRNSAAMAKVFTTLERQGITRTDIQTSRFDVSPRYKTYPRGQSGPRTIIGYTVSNQVGVMVRKIDMLGGLIDAIVADGANQFQGLSFGFADEGPLRDEARRLAAADVRRKATLYADALGVKLGPILRVREQSASRPQPAMEFAAARMRSDVPIAAGESSLAVSLSVDYALE